MGRGQGVTADGDGFPFVVMECSGTNTVAAQPRECTKSLINAPRWSAVHGAPFTTTAAANITNPPGSTGPSPLPPPASVPRRTPWAPTSRSPARPPLCSRACGGTVPSALSTSSTWVPPALRDLDQTPRSYQALGSKVTFSKAKSWPHGLLTAPPHSCHSPWSALSRPHGPRPHGPRRGSSPRGRGLGAVLAAGGLTLPSETPGAP